MEDNIKRDSEDTVLKTDGDEDKAVEPAEVDTEEKPASDEEKPKKEKLTRVKKADLDKARAERDDYLAALMRERADFDNYKKRNAVSVSKAYADGKAEAVLAVLPVLDNFERAAGASCCDEAYKSGVDLVHRQLSDAVKALGAEEIDALGKEFDPNLHNAVMQVPCEEGDDSGIVKAVLMKGYRIGDKVLRHAMVQVTE